MNARSMCLAFALMALALPAFGDPKAYEVVQYRARAAGLTIDFDFADGYPEASDLRITEAGKRKSTKFVLDQSGEMRFVPEKRRAGDEQVMLKMNMDDGPADKVAGVYRSGDRTIEFTLVQR